jgi:hypothetical protein
MTGLDGGRIAARGFQYQYLRTLEGILAALDRPQVYACRVEGPPLSSSLADVDAVDFDLVDTDGRSLLSAQVKSAGPGVRMGASAALHALLRLTHASEADRYELITAAAPDRKCRALARTLAEYAGDVARFHAALIRLFAGTMMSETVGAISAADLGRLGRARIVTDFRSQQELRRELHVRLGDLRRRARRGLDERAAGLVLGYLVGETLRRASDQDASEWLISEFEADVLAEDRVLCQALGSRGRSVVFGPYPRSPMSPGPR